MRAGVLDAVTRDIHSGHIQRQDFDRIRRRTQIVRAFSVSHTIAAARVAHGRYDQKIVSDLAKPEEPPDALETKGVGSRILWDGTKTLGRTPTKHHGAVIKTRIILNKTDSCI